MKIPWYKLYSVKLWLLVFILLLSLTLTFFLEVEMFKAWSTLVLALYGLFIGGNVTTKAVSNITTVKKAIKDVQDS